MSNFEKQNDVTNTSEKTETKLIESEISEQLILEHPTYRQLEDKLTQTEQKAQEYMDGLLRTKAELENVQRRTERDIANAHKYALEKFASELLIVVDNLERSLVVKSSEQEKLKEFYYGIELTLKFFLEVLQKFSIVPINPFGETFNPDQHMAVTTKEDKNAKSNTILEVVQKGYWLKDRLLRPALVIVAK